MNKVLSLLISLLVLCSVVSADPYKDHFMIANKIDPDYMHAKVSKHRSMGHRIKERILVDDISAKALNLNMVVVNI